MSSNDVTMATAPGADGDEMDAKAQEVREQAETLIQQEQMDNDMAQRVREEAEERIKKMAVNKWADKIFEQMRPHEKTLSTQMAQLMSEMRTIGSKVEVLQQKAATTTEGPIQTVPTGPGQPTTQPSAPTHPGFASAAMAAPNQGLGSTSTAAAPNQGLGVLADHTCANWKPYDEDDERKYSLESWLCHMRYYAEANNWSIFQTYRKAMAMGSNKLRSRLKGLTPENKGHWTLQEYLNQVEKVLLVGKPNRYQRCLQAFRDTYQKPGESIIDYEYRYRSIIQECGSDMDNITDPVWKEIAVRNFVGGVANRDLRFQCAQRNFTSMEKAMEFILDREVTEGVRDMLDNQGKTSFHDDSGVSRINEKKTWVKKSEEPAETKTWRKKKTQGACHYCKREGHWVKDCFRKKFDEELKERDERSMAKYRPKATTRPKQSAQKRQKTKKKSFVQQMNTEAVSEEEEEEEDRNEEAEKVHNKNFQ